MSTETRAKAPAASRAKTGGAPRHAARPSGAAHTRKARARRITHAKANPFKSLISRFVKPSNGARKPRKPRNPANTRAALWLWCFPVGLSLMWRSDCTWKRGVKIGISTAMVALLAAIFVVPLPKVGARSNGVEIVAGRPEVEVYGPALPSLIVPGYTKETTGSIIAEDHGSDVHYVYAADDAECYHEYDCKFAFASSQRLTVYEAYYLGFKPCGRCKPPVYTPGVTDPLTAGIIAGEGSAADATAEATATGAAS